MIMNRSRAFIFIFALCTMHGVINAQKIFSKAAEISFYSDTPVEKIEAHNKQGTCVVDLETGRVEVALLIKGFHFKKALME